MELVPQPSPLAAVAGRGADGQGLGVPPFLHPGWCLAALPHRRIADDAFSTLRDGTLTLAVQPGRRLLPGGGTGFVGVPFGATARLVLLYLQAEALRTGSRQVEVGDGLAAWLDALGPSCSGGSAGGDAMVWDQAERVAAARFFLQAENGRAQAFGGGGIVERACLREEERPGAGPRCVVEEVWLSRGFCDAVREHAVPLDRRALRRLRTSPLAIDAYAWLAFGLRVLQRPARVGWAELHAWFGREYGGRVAFEGAFGKAMEDVLAVHPGAAGRVEETARGFLFHPVAPRRSPTRTSARPGQDALPGAS